MSLPKMALDLASTVSSGSRVSEILQASEIAARTAAERAGVEIRELATVPEFKEAGDVFSDIWGKRYDLGPPINADLLRALSHAGNYVSAAFDNEGMRGALVGFLGWDRGELHLHSHILGVVPSQQVRGLGFALKLHQRAWTLEHDLDTMEWTFDPLVRRNGYFNLTKLGGTIADYFVNFYGVMDDQQNHQEDSDRILLRWDLRSPRTEAAAAGAPPDPLASVDGTPPLLALRSDPGGAPVVDSIVSAPDHVLLEVPADIVKMRAESPEVAREWRLALRHAMTAALDAGYVCEGMSRAGEYVFRAKPGS